MHYKKRAVDPLYFLLNKPAGYVCSAVSDRSPVVLDLFPKEYLVSPEGAKLHTAGRLDKDTQGLLLVTNDGRFSNYLTRPESNVSKTYLVGLKNPVSQEQQQEYIDRIAAGVMMPPDKKAGAQMSGSASITWKNENVLSETASAESIILPEADLNRKIATCTITLEEGKFHEVRRIFQALGNEVIYLKRIQIHTLQLPETLKSGSWIKMTAEDLKISFPEFFNPKPATIPFPGLRRST